MWEHQNNNTIKRHLAFKYTSKNPALYKEGERRCCSVRLAFDQRNRHLSSQRRRKYFGNYVRDGAPVASSWRHNGPDVFWVGAIITPRQRKLTSNASFLWRNLDSFAAGISLFIATTDLGKWVEGIAYVCQT